MRVAVIGGGPAGSSAAALLARHGVEVVIFEKASFPRHHVGESLQPASLALLDQHFGLGPTLREAGFALKFGAVYVWGEGREPWTVLFDEALEAALPGLDEAGLLGGPWERALQVERARFDQILLENALSQGATLRRAEVRRVLFEGERAVGVELAEGEERFDQVIDASGQRGVIGRQLGLVRRLEDLRSTATYAYFDGLGGVPGVLGRHVQWVVSIPEGWCWFIPISPTRTSVGVVTHQPRRLGEAELLGLLDKAGLPHGDRCEELYFAQDWSYANTRLAGPGWWLAGDAAAFVDPILSGGVDFALRGGLNAALGILRLRDGEEEAALGAAYESRFLQEFHAYLRLARYWYGNNRSVQGLFWEAHAEIPPHASATPLRAFIWLTTGKYAAERHVKVFQEWQEKKMFKALGVDGAALRKARSSS